MGINGKMYNAPKSLYSCVSSCIIINGLRTDWFDVTTGLRQGCCLSPLLFNIFINDLALKIKSLGLGINIGNDETVSLMMYADDIVLLAESENDLQRMLNAFCDWCSANFMSININKTNIVHLDQNRRQNMFYFYIW